METIFEIQRIKQVKEEVKIYNSTSIKTPEDAYNIAKEFIGEDDREIFFVMCLTTQNKVVAVHRCHVGSVMQSLVSSREVFKPAIKNNASTIMVAHNHPGGGYPKESEADVRMSKKLAEAGEILDIPVLDSIIVGDFHFVSLKDKGLM